MLSLTRIAVVAVVLAQAAEESIAGRLATVESTNRRLTIVADGQTTLLELSVDADAEIRAGEDTIALRDLVTEVGSRGKISYRMESGRRVARANIVERQPPG